MQRSAFALTTRSSTAKRSLLAPGLLAVAAFTANAQFSYPPVVFPASGDNLAQTQTINLTLTSASAIRSISIPLGFIGNPDFSLIDQGGCVEDGTTVNPAGTICRLLIRFRPTAAGRRNGSLVITDGSGNATAVGLSGVGYYPQIGITPAAAKVVAGLGPSIAAFAGDGGASILASLSAPQGIATDSFGNAYFADSGNNVVRMLDPFGNITTVAGGGATAGAAADGGLATAAQLWQPTRVAVDSAGNLFIAETGSNVIRRVAMSTTRRITTVAGSFAAGFSDGTSAITAKLSTPLGIALDPDGNLYIADAGNQRIRKLDASSGTISTLAGTGEQGFNAASTAALSAQFSNPTDLALDSQGALFISDAGNHVVRKLSAGNVTVFAGTGIAGNSGDGGAAASAKLATPAGLTLTAANDVYIVDTAAGIVRKVQSSDGTIETIAGDAKDAGSYTAGVSPSTSTRLNQPTGLALDSQGNLFLTDSSNNVVREISPSPGQLNFAAQAAGNTSATLALRVANIGNAPLTLVSVAAANSTTSANFVLANSTTEPCGSTLAPGVRCAYSVSFSPPASGFISGEIDVTHVSNNPNFNSVEPVYLTGGQVPALTISPASVAPVVAGDVLNAVFSASGGFGAIALDIEGTLPPGITSSASNGSITLSGTTTQAGTYPVTIFATDILGRTAAKTYSLQVLPTIIAMMVNESLSVSDSLTEVPGLFMTVTESLHVADNVSELPGLTLLVTESLRVIDTLSEVPPPVIDIIESIHVSDGVNSLLALSLPVVETIHVSDGINNLLALSLPVRETIHVSDSALELPSVSLPILELIHVTDATGGVSSLLLNVTETIHVSDSVQSAAGQLTQTITVASIPTHTYGDAIFSTSASSSSGLPVTATVLSGPATLSGSLLNLTGAGTVSLHFTQPGDATYAAAAPVDVSFTVSRATATVSVSNVSRAFETPNPNFSYTLSGLVHGDSANSLTGAPSFSTTAVLNSPAGSYPLTPSQGTLSSPNYTFRFVVGTLTVTGHVAQTITFASIPNVPLSVGTLTLTAHSTSGLTVTYLVDGPATIQKGQLTLTGPGTVTVRAMQNGNATFDPATSVTRTFTVSP